MSNHLRVPKARRLALGRLTMEQIEGGDDDLTIKDRSKAQKGKNAEEAVRKVLVDVATHHPNFDFQRMFDARSAGGRFPAQIADYEFFCRVTPAQTVHGVLEVKETEHESRLSAYLIARDKKRIHIKMKRWERRAAAGGFMYIILHHKTTGLWRAVDMTELKLGESSWDVSEFKTYDSASEAVKAALPMSFTNGGK